MQFKKALKSPIAERGRSIKVLSISKKTKRYKVWYALCLPYGRISLREQASVYKIALSYEFFENKLNNLNVV
jgi:hypothetical protein